MIGTIVTGIKLFGIGKSLAIFAAVFGALVLGYAVWHHKVYQSGVDDTIAKIARADAKTVERASKARSVLKDCQARSLSWDQTTGRCK